jgi:hypothetical protein
MLDHPFNYLDVKRQQNGLVEPKKNLSGRRGLGSPRARYSIWAEGDAKSTISRNNGVSFARSYSISVI